MKRYIATAPKKVSRLATEGQQTSGDIYCARDTRRILGILLNSGDSVADGRKERSWNNDRQDRTVRSQGNSIFN